MGESNVLGRSVTLLLMLGVLAAAWHLFTAFDGGTGASALSWSVPWMPSLGVDLHFAVDGYNVYLLLLTALLFPVVLLFT